MGADLVALTREAAVIAVNRIFRHMLPTPVVCILLLLLLGEGGTVLGVCFLVKGGGWGVGWGGNIYTPFNAQARTKYA